MPQEAPSPSSRQSVAADPVVLVVPVVVVVLVLDAGSVVVIDGRQAAIPPQRAMIRRAQRFGRIGSARQCEPTY